MDPLSTKSTQVLLGVAAPEPEWFPAFARYGASIDFGFGSLEATQVPEITGLFTYTPVLRTETNTFLAPVRESEGGVTGRGVTPPASSRTEEENTLISVHETGV